MYRFISKIKTYEVMMVLIDMWSNNERKTFTIPQKNDDEKEMSFNEWLTYGLDKKFIVRTSWTDCAQEGA